MILQTQVIPVRSPPDGGRVVCCRPRLAVVRRPRQISVPTWDNRAAWRSGSVGWARRATNPGPPAIQGTLLITEWLSALVATLEAQPGSPLLLESFAGSTALLRD